MKTQTGKIINGIYYPYIYCVVCGQKLNLKPRGRKRTTCSERCRVTYKSDCAKWVTASVDAVLDGKEEPQHPYHVFVEL